MLYGERVQLRLGIEGALALVEVRDFSPGIAQASMSLAFEPHVRLSHGQQSNRAGTGFGLGIARNIIQAHGGEIRLHNHAEGGTGGDGIAAGSDDACRLDTAPVLIASHAGNTGATGRSSYG